MASEIHQDVCALLLCGGKGQRMGGKDKPLERWRSKSMIDWVIDSLPPQMPVIVSANRNLEQYALCGEVITDASVEGLAHAGPLSGILAGLRHCHTPWLVVAPGDTPGLQRGWVERLWQAHDGRDAVVAHDGTRQQHLHILLDTSVADHLADYIRNGGYRVHAWLAQINLAVVQFPNAEMFHNINTFDELS